MMKEFNTNIEIHIYDIDNTLVETMKAQIDAKDKENLGKSSNSGSQTESAASPSGY